MNNDYRVVPWKKGWGIDDGHPICKNYRGYATRELAEEAMAKMIFNERMHYAKEALRG